MKTLVTALILLFVASASYGQSRSDLESEIAALKAQIAAKRPVVEGLSQPWKKSSALFLGFSAAPFASLVREISALPEAQRRVDFAVVAAHGQLWGWDADCIIAGHKYSDEGAYVEFKDPNYRVEANARFSNLDASWVPGQGLRFSLDVAARLGIGTVHWHRKPCVGGGVGGDAGPMTCDAAARLSTLSSVALNQSAIQYTSTIDLNRVGYGCSISLGSLGTLTIPELFKVPGNVAFNGSMPLPVSASGVLGADGSPLRKAYDIRLVNPSLVMATEGVDIGTDVSIVWR